MADPTADNTYFDFDAASDNSCADQVSSEELRPLYKFFTYPDLSNDQVPESGSTMSTQQIQQAEQRAAMRGPDPVLAPYVAPEMEQVWPTLSPPPSPVGFNAGAENFDYEEFAVFYQPVLQQQEQQEQQQQQQQEQQQQHYQHQQQQSMPQTTFQQQQPAFAPAIQSIRHIGNLFPKPPAHGQMLTMMHKPVSVPCSIGVQSPLNIHQCPSVSFAPITHQQRAPFSPYAVDQELRFNPHPRRPGELPREPRRIIIEATHHPVGGLSPLTPTAVYQTAQSNHLPLRPGELPTGPGFIPPERALNPAGALSTFPPNADDPKLRPAHRLRRPGELPTGLGFSAPQPAKHPAQARHPSPAANQQRPQTATYTPPDTQEREEHISMTTPKPPLANDKPPANKTPTIKGSMPFGTTEPKPAPKPLGRPRKAAPAPTTGAWINSTVPRSEHNDTTMHGRNSLRGAGSEARMAEPWNRPSVKDKGKDGDKGRCESRDGAETRAADESESKSESRSAGMGKGKEKEGAVRRDGETHLMAQKKEEEEDREGGAELHSAGQQQGLRGEEAGAEAEAQAQEGVGVSCISDPRKTLHH